MGFFRDTEHLYRVLGALFERLRGEDEVARRLRESDLTVRFIFREPDGAITVNLTQWPISFECGESELHADVEMTQSADTAHLFWLGKVSVPSAIATRKIIARGSVPKALALLPAIRPAFDIYPEVLKELGETELLEAARAAEAVRSRRWEGLTALLSRFRPKPSIDYDALNRHLIPLAEEIAPYVEQFSTRDLSVEQGELKREMLRRMMLIREFEKALAAEFATGNLPSEALHLSIGQEATAVGVCFAMREDDYMTTTHRGHGHMLAKGADVRGMMAEALAKVTGLCKGKGGCMHVTDSRVGAVGANGIVGASVVLGAGAAWSAKYRNTDRVAVCFLGDGATAQGMFHEGMNFAAVRRLPLVAVVENNLYGEFTPFSEHCPVERVSERAAAYGIPGITVDGNDVWAVYDAAKAAIERARRGLGPTLLECLTYRISGHTEGEAAEYRSDEEVEDWKAKDPIDRLTAQMLAEGLLRQGDVERMQESVQGEVRAALDFAASSREPPLEELDADVFALDFQILYSAEPVPKGRREITYAAALWEALAEEMGRDSSVYLLGEDVSTGGYFSVSAGLIDEFGPMRVVDTPISEYAILDSAIGAAMTGLRPVAEIMFADFLASCMDPLLNQAPKLRFMSGGQYRVPLVVRAPGGAGIGMAAQHSQTLEGLFLNIPGWILMAPSTPYDAKGLLKAAIRSNNPVLFFENKLLYSSVGPVPDKDYVLPIGVADVKREGQDMTIVAVGAAVPLALEAAEALSQEGFAAEVLDPRTLYPMDWAAIVRSVVKTGRLLVVELGPLTGGVGSEIVARVQEVAWGALKGPARRVAGRDAPIAYNRRLENAAVPDAQQIAGVARGMLRGG